MTRGTAEHMIKHNLDKLDDNWIRFFWAVVARELNKREKARREVKAQKSRHVF